MDNKKDINFQEIMIKIKRWGQALGFEQLAITDTDVHQADARLSEWLAQGHHGTMNYLSKNRQLRNTPQNLVANTCSIIMARLNYLPQDPKIIKILGDKTKGYISRYALGRDYHKLVRKKLTQLAKYIEAEVGAFGYRAFADSAPVFEKPLAAKAGLGWMGKNTLILNRQAGSWFFLGALYTTLPLPKDQPVTNHCGSCTACLDICPTQAFSAPYVLNANRCISYLTIEYKGSIPLELRSKMGNRIFGCDDCQLICPWNKFARVTAIPDFEPRHQLDQSSLIALFAWDEDTFLRKTEGSAIRRAGYECWLRNIAVALGNAPKSPEVTEALLTRKNHFSALVREHVTWALSVMST